jgi:hypothetical protein
MAKRNENPHCGRDYDRCTLDETCPDELVALLDMTLAELRATRNFGRTDALKAAACRELEARSWEPFNGTN